jgi:hypothetical protein
MNILSKYLSSLNEDYNVVDNWEVLVSKARKEYDILYKPCIAKCPSTGTILKKKDPACVAKCHIEACKRAISYLKSDSSRCKSHLPNQQKQCYKIYKELIEEYIEAIKKK